MAEGSRTGFHLWERRKVRPPGNKPRIRAARSLVLVMVDRLIEMLIEQDYPHSPRGR